MKINEIGKQQRKKINETKSWFFAKIDRNEKPSPRLRETQIGRIRNEREDIPLTYLLYKKNYKGILCTMYLTIYINLDDMDKF